MGNNTKSYDFLHYLNDTTLFKTIQSFDNRIKKNLREDCIETRPSVSNGLWCCILLPTILSLYSLQQEVSVLYKTVACLSVGIFCYCILCIIFMSISCLVLTENVYGGCAASSFVAALLLYGVLDQGLIFSTTYSLITIFMFSTLLRESLTKFPKTFTIGEAMLVVQGIVLLLMAVFLRTFHNIGDKSDEEMEFVNVINLTILSSVGIIVTALVLLEDNQRNMKTLYSLISIAGTYALIMLQFFVGLDCLIVIPSYVFLDAHRAQLFVLWLALSIVAGVTLTFRTRLAVKATTVTRKVFHVLASLVFLTGIVSDIHLTTLAAGFGFAAMILAEALRKSEIEPVSSALQAAFRVYSDEKDAGSFAMTPLYLYVGLASPLLLVPARRGAGAWGGTGAGAGLGTGAGAVQLELLAGVLATGVGDTAASWFGARYGFNKWADGHKSLQGTAFNIISQVTTVYALEFFGLITTRNGLFRIVVASVFSGLVEAKTHQIDNLILPFITIIGFQMTWFLC